MWKNQGRVKIICNTARIQYKGVYKCTYRVRLALLHVAVEEPREDGRGARPPGLTHHLVGPPGAQGPLQATHLHALGPDCRNHGASRGYG